MIKTGNDSWESSFLDDVNITHYQSVVTALSGSSFGGHASLFLEYFLKGRQYPEMTMFDLWTPPKGGRVTIRETPVQLILDGNIISTALPKMNVDNTPKQGTEGIRSTHHHSYVIDSDKTSMLLLAIQRFKDKSRSGRYRYLKAGGALGVVFSLPGHRALNCADFVLKVLNEAGIANIPYRLVDTPYRIAT